MLTGSQSKVVARNVPGFKERRRTISTSADSEGTEQFGRTDSEMTSQSKSSYGRRKSFQEAAFTSLVCDDTSADLLYDSPDKLDDVLHTSQAAAPQGFSKEALFKSLVCDDTSADLHYDTIAEFDGVLWPWASLAGKAFEKGAFSKRNLIYDDTSADLHLGEEEPIDILTDISALWIKQVSGQSDFDCKLSSSLHIG
mmetsp:Transcript_90480/g.166096  ORF Transcript_90480/g.166096 Transcript_90480/m.166096 type:complete len:197 (-) Transcript_90480:171-761(-)